MRTTKHRAGWAHLYFLLLALLLAAPVNAGEPRLIAVLEIGLVDTSVGDPSARPDATAKARMDRTLQILREGIAARDAYVVADPAEVAAAVDVHARGRRMFRCGHCQLAAGQALDADLVAVAWVHKVSNLILGMTLAVADIGEERLVHRESVSFRGDTDIAWERAARVLVERLP